MDKYIEVMRIRFLTMLAYRSNYYTGILIYTINIGAYYFLWKAIYGAKPDIENVSLLQMTTYVAISWMARAFYFNNIDREIALDIRDGKIAVELIRPYQYLVMKLMQALGEGIFRFFLFATPGFIIVSLIFPVSFPTDLNRWMLFFVSLFFSFIINTQINLLTGVTTFFFFNNDGIIRAKRVLIDLFSGLLIPLNLFPLWAQSAMNWLPFQGISYIPSMIFSNAFEGNKLLGMIGVQLFWSLFLIIPVQLIWVTAKKRIVVQGG